MNDRENEKTIFKDNFKGRKLISRDPNQDKKTVFSSAPILNLVNK